MKPANGGFSPLDHRLGVNESGYSDRLSRDMAWLSSLLPSYRAAQQVFERIGHKEIPTQSLWRRTQVEGQRQKEEGEAEQARVSPERVVLGPAGADHQQVKGVSLDGAMVNIRGEGWKEFKVGTVYDVVIKPGRDPRTQEKVELPGASNPHYTAVLGDAERFGRALWLLAVRQGIPRAARSSVTADGAEWIWNLVADYFPDSVQIVDWYHGEEHLAKASQALYPDDEHEATRWRKRMQEALYQGEVWRIIQALEGRGLEGEAGYFRTHQRRMQYQEFREEGYPIGSGTVESGCKQYKVRLTGPGMRWSRAGAQRMLVLRSQVMAAC